MLPLSDSTLVNSSFTYLPQQPYSTHSAHPANGHEEADALQDGGVSSKNIRPFPPEILFMFVQTLRPKSMLSFSLSCMLFRDVVTQKKLDQAVLNEFEPYLVCSAADQEKFNFEGYSEEDWALDQTLLSYFLLCESGKKSLNEDPALKMIVNAILSEVSDDCITKQREAIKDALASEDKQTQLSALKEMHKLDCQQNNKGELALILFEYRKELKKVMANLDIEKPLSPATIQQEVLAPVQQRKKTYLCVLRSIYQAQAKYRPFLEARQKFSDPEQVGEAFSHITTDPEQRSPVAIERKRLEGLYSRDESANNNWSAYL